MPVKNSVSAIIVAILLPLIAAGQSAENDAGENEMNSEFIGISTVSYAVDDIGKAKDWYAGAFGVEPYFDEPFYVGFNINGYELGLQPSEGERSPGNTSTAYWAVRDIEKTFARFIELGALEVEKPNDVGGGVIVATVKDPWGNLIGLIVNPGFRK